MFSQVYDTYKAIYGEHHQSTINTLINLATTYRDVHQYAKAAELYEVAIEGRAATEGD